MMVLSEEWLWLSRVSPNGGEHASLVGTLRCVSSYRWENNGVDGSSRGMAESGLLYTFFLDSSRLLIQVFLRNNTRTVVTMVMMMTMTMTVMVMVDFRSRAQWLIVSLR